MIAPLLLLAALAPAALELPLDPSLPRRAVLLLDADQPPARIELLPEGRAIASGWYRFGPTVLVAVPLSEDSGEGAAIRYVPRQAGAETGVRIRAVLEPVGVPTTAPQRGKLLVLDLPPRSSLRALLLRGELDGVRLLFEGKILSLREEPYAGRKVALVPAGPAAPLVVAPLDPSAEVSIRTASLHAGYPLPAPETFRLPAGEAGEYSFEVPERWSDALLEFDSFDADRPGELAVEFEGRAVLPSSAARDEGLEGGWSGRRAVFLPAEAFAHGRASLLTFRFAPPADPGAGPDRGAGLRRLVLDVPVPAAGPFGLGREGDGDHGGELLLSWWPASVEPQVLRLRASGLDRSGPIGVYSAGSEVGSIALLAGLAEREAELILPAELVRPATLNAIALRPARGAWGGSEWSVSELTLAPLPPTPVPGTPPSPPRPGGPTLSSAPLTMPGAAPASQLLAIAEDPPPLPGQPAEPVGGIAFTAGFPAAEATPGGAPAGRPTGLSISGVPLGPPRPPAGPGPAEFTGPVPSHPAPSGASGEGQPGAPSLVRGPDLPPARAPEIGARPLPTPAGTRLDIASDPPGARVFLSRTPGYRGSFLGLTPFSFTEETTGQVFLRFDRPGSHDAWVAAWLQGEGVLSLSRALLPWKGIDFARPSDPRIPPARLVREGYAAPAPADLDGDGRVDLVIGGDKGGVVWLRDEESIGRPRFGAPQALRRSDGRPLEVPGYAAPAAADWDGDGLVDLLVGAKNGEIHFFRRAPLNRGLAFEARGVLVADGAALSVGNDASPLVVDWNGDSRPDLLVGSGYGVIVLFEGLGAGALTQRGPLAQNGEPLQFLLDVAPIDLNDWTGDGLRDLVLAGMYGNVLLYPGRSASGGRPDFAAPRPITIRGGLDLYVGTYPHGFALDLDADGYRDLLFGNSAGEILWLRGGEPHEFDEIEPIVTPVGGRK